MLNGPFFVSPKTDITQFAAAFNFPLFALNLYILQTDKKTCHVIS